MADQTVVDKPLPAPIEITAPFWDGLKRHLVRLQRCDACKAWVWYPRARCTGCLSDQLSWQTVSGAGTIHTFTVARQATHPAFAQEVPQLLAVVELEEGVKMTTTLVGTTPEALRVGQRVEPVFDDTLTMTLLRFRPVLA